MRELRVDMFSTVDGYGSGGPRPEPYWGATGEGPVFAELPDVDLSLAGTSVIDDRLVLLDYRVCGN